MTGILVGIFALAIAVLIQRLMLHGRAKRLEATEQAFRFHAIRDELQLLAVQGIIRQDEEPYRFLMYTANLAINNAGVMKLRDVLYIARTVKRTTPNLFFQKIEREPEEVQRVAAETFRALTDMLTTNDRLVYLGLRCAGATVRAWRFLQPIVRAAVRALNQLTTRVSPSHAEAIRYARDYSDLSESIAA